MGTMTVRENLLFSLNLRDRHGLTGEEKDARVSFVIRELGLERVADSFVGDHLIRGLRCACACV